MLELEIKDPGASGGPGSLLGPENAVRFLIAVARLEQPVNGDVRGFVPSLPENSPALDAENGPGK